MVLLTRVRRFRTSCLRSALGRCAIAVSALLVGLILAPDTAVAQSALTLKGAQRIAVERSARLAAGDAMISASREMSVAAGQLPDAVFKFGIDNLPADGADQFSLARDFMTMRRIGITQELTRTEKRRFKSERYTREAELAVTERSASEAAIQRDTALAWLDRYYLERMRTVMTAQAEEAGLEIEAAEGAYRAGRGSQAEVLAARASRVALHDRLSELDRRLRSARAMLARWAGEAADAPLAGEPDISAVRINPRALDRELEYHPEIAVLGRQVAIAEADALLAKANKQADWSVELAYQQRGPAYSNMISIGVSVPLQWDQKNRQERELRARLALVDRAKAQQQDGLRAHVAEVRAMLNEWENGLERCGRYDRELLPLAADRTQAALVAYRGGKSDLAAVLAARRNEIDVRIQRVQLEMDTARVWAQLNFLVPDGAHESRPASTSSSKERK